MAAARKRTPAWKIPKVRKRLTNKHLTEWMRAVETGAVVACKEQHQLMAYVRHVFATEKLWIDEERDARYAEYETLFPFELYPEEWFIHTLWLCTFREDGRPRWPELLWLTGRGSGKNGFIGFEAFCAMTGVNGIRNYNVDICATSEDQAKTSFDDVYGVLNTDDNLRRTRKGWDWTKELITNKATGSKLRFRSNNTKTKDGGRPGMVIFDEVHAYEDFGNINVFMGGLGKVPHPRIAYITTDGDVREGVLDTLKDRAMAILEGREGDNGLLPVINRLDSRDEIDDPKMWVKACVRYLYSLDLLDEAMREYASWKRNPAKYAAFVTKRMNLPEERSALAVAKWSDIKATDADNEVPAGTPCVIGIDYAKTTDFVSVVRLHRVDGRLVGCHHSWWCTNSSDACYVKFPLNEAEDEGTLTIVDAVEISPDTVADYVAQIDEVYPVEAVGIDYYRFTLMQKALAEKGFLPDKEGGIVKLTRPSDQMLVQPVINSVFVNQSLAMGHDRLWRWFTNNTVLEPAANGNYKYAKQDIHARKTDGFMAFVAAMAVIGPLDEETGEPEIMPPLIL